MRDSRYKNMDQGYPGQSRYMQMIRNASMLSFLFHLSTRFQKSFNTFTPVNRKVFCNVLRKVLRYQFDKSFLAM